MLLQIGVHYDGVFYEFVPWNGVLSWEIAQWGYWYMAAENETHMVILHLLVIFSSLHRASVKSFQTFCKYNIYGHVDLVD